MAEPEDATAGDTAAGNTSPGDTAAERRGRRTIRIAQLGLVLAALGLWGSSRMPWVSVRSFDGLGQPRTITLSGGTWSTALVPLALLLLAAAAAALAVRGWALRVLALLAAAASAASGYLAISQWIVPQVAVRAADLAQVPVATLVGSQRFYWGAVLALAAAVIALAAAVLLMRSAGTGRAATTKYAAPGARRASARSVAAAGPRAGQRGEPADEQSSAQTSGEDTERVSERMMWDALDEGHDPTEGRNDSGSEGR
ncbi:TIGR02234 family membrane protein [Mycolicibacterium palauense]|uniref:TIGR02234 family membrane protein n=1 Tax=Mycolicibacterium palauense TaxID=2034511 RepID=UPI000BFED632|nr:TIGR02234 family membrane protein [Mycolicibacterium palauense]